jgi:hypothetical protein
MADHRTMRGRKPLPAPFPAVALQASSALMLLSRHNFSPPPVITWTASPAAPAGAAVDMPHSLPALFTCGSWPLTDDGGGDRTI